MAQVIDNDTIALRIVDEDFEFDGLLELAEEERFSGETEDVVVTLDPATGEVSVLNSDTSTALYDYSIGPLDLQTSATEAEAEEGEADSTAETSDASETPAAP